MTIQTAALVLIGLIEDRQKNVDLNASAWEVYSGFYDKGTVQDIPGKKVILTVIAGADSDLLDNVAAIIASIDGVV